MRVLGLDNATTKCGYAVIDDGELVDYGLINLKKECGYKAKYMERILKLVQMVDVMVLEDDIDKLFIEETHLASKGSKRRNVSVFRKLTELAGCIKMVGESREVEYYAVLPSSWRSEHNMTRERKEQKKSAIKIANEIYGLDLKSKDDDIAEAILIARHGYNKYK